MGMIPIVIVGWIAVNATNEGVVTDSGFRLQVAAEHAGESIDRNLFERYGDVQAFAANPYALRLAVAGESQTVVDFLTRTYGIYDLMLVVGADGTVLTTNTIDGFGEPLETSSLVGRDVSDQEWFQTIASGNTPEGGTVYGQAERNGLVGEIYGDERITLAFSAPILGGDGEFLGVWHNQASFDRVVADIMDGVQSGMESTGRTELASQVLTPEGLLLYTSGAGEVFDTNLRSLAGDESVASVGDSETGFDEERNLATGNQDLVGFSTADGALGFEGYEWRIIMRQDLGAASAGSNSLVGVLIVVGLVAAVIISAVAFALARSVSRPISAVASKARLIAEGELDVEPLNLKRSDEVGELAASFDHMAEVLGVVGDQTRLIADGELSSDRLEVEVPGQLGAAFATMIASLREMVSQLKTNSAALGDASSELTALSEGMGDQAVSTSTEASRAVQTGDEVSSRVHSVAQAIDEMSTSLGLVAGRTTEAQTIASETMGISKVTTTSMEKLSESSEQIGHAVKAIQSIAEQTNLLALNATIEAARAGDAGKGFAVVANEVKALANQTAEATEQITEQVRVIQEDTAAATEANTEISLGIERINDISNGIANAIADQSTATATIGRDVAEASTGSASIAETITEVALAADETQSATRSTLSSAQALSDMATDLSKLVGNYR